VLYSLIQQVCRNGECVGSICEAHDMVQCYLQGDLKDKRQDKSILCHLACIGEKTGNVCMDSFQIEGMETSTNTSGLILKPGSPCIGTLGYCDIFSKCRPVDGEGPLSRLKNLLLNPVTLSAIREWVTVSFVFFFICGYRKSGREMDFKPAFKVQKVIFSLVL